MTLPEPIASALRPVPRAAPEAELRAIREVGTDELVRRAKRGEQAAYLQLFDRYHDEVYRFATRRLGDASLGQEAAAATMADAFASLHRYRRVGAPFEAWLYAIARRRVADHLRAALRRRARIEHVLPVEDPATGVVDRARVRELLARLPAVERDVIELRFMEDLDVEETAARLGKSPGAVRVAQHRALARLRDLMAVDR